MGNRHFLSYRECQGLDRISNEYNLTIVAAAGGGNWTSGGSWVGGVPPTAADDAQLTLTSGNITIDNGGAVCRSLDCTGYTGTLTHNTASTLTIGDATAGLSSIALKLVAGMTYAPASTTTSVIALNSTSATQQTIETGLLSLTNTISFPNSGANQGSYLFNDNMTTAFLSQNGAIVNTNGKTITLSGSWSWGGANVKTVTLGASVINISGSAISWNNNTSGGLTVNAGTSSITLSGGSNTFGGGGQTYNSVTLTNGGTSTISGTNTFSNLTITGAAAKTCVYNLSANQTVTTTLTLNGNSRINQMIFQSNTIGTARTITTTGATVTCTNTDFMDITLSVAKDVSGQTDVGDGGGNSGITFPAPVTQTWNGTSGGNWSANAWTTRVPLPQDPVVINAAFSASQTVTADMPRLGKDIDWTGATGTPTFNLASAYDIFGSVIFISGMTIGGGAGNGILRGRGTHTITSAGKSLVANLTMFNFGGSYTLQDALSVGGNLVQANGSFNANGFNVTCGTFNSNTSNTRTLTMGSGTWSLTSTATATIWTIATTTGLAFSGASSTITVTSTSANTRTVQFGNGAALQYGTFNYVLAGSTGKLSISKDLATQPTINVFNFSDASNARTLELNDLGGALNFNTFNMQGTAGKLMTLDTTVAATHFISKSSGIVNCDFLAIRNSNAGGGATWYAGANSTNLGGNSGWLFQAAPGGAAATNQLLLGVG